MKRNTELENKINDFARQVLNDELDSTFFTDELDDTYGSKLKLLYGVNYLVEMISVTLGAKGRTVLYNDRMTNKPRVTKDGVTVANNVSHPDAFVTMAIDIVKEASQQTVKTSGDGTTTTALFARYLINVGHYLMEKLNMSYYEVSMLFDQLKNEYVNAVNSLSLNVEEHFEKLLNVATVSSNDNEIGELLYSILNEIGIHGFIEVKKSSNTSDKIETVTGIKLHKGFIAPQFVNNKVKMEYKAENVFIVPINEVLRTIDQVRIPMQYITDQTGNSNPNILFLVNDIESTLLSSLITTKVSNPSLNIMFVENDGFGDRKIDILNTIVTLTSGGGLQVNNESLPIGFAEEVIVNADYTSIINGHVNEPLLESEIEDTEYKLANYEELELEPNEVAYLKRKLSFLKGGSAVIHVGGMTEVEMIERKDRIDDAVEALRAAVNGGICVGGGYTLNQVYNMLDETAFKHMLSKYDEETQNIILTVLFFTVLEPVRQLCKNSDFDFNVVLNNLNESKGYNAISNSFHELDEYEIYDPARVLVDSFSNACAVAKSILSIKRSLYN